MLDPATVMPEATAKVFSILENLPELREFYLIGGTALSLHLEHRLSEDLDFITTQHSKLTRPEIDAAVAKLDAAGLRVSRDDPDAAYDDFLIAGMSLHDYSQNFIVGDKCKLTFFSGDPHHQRLLQTPLKPNGPTVASLPELQNLKAVVCASRSNSRDWLDLYLLARNHGFTLKKWEAAFEKAGLPQDHFENALKRVASGALPPTDPGFRPLMANPPTISEITAYFKKWADKYRNRRSGSFRNSLSVFAGISRMDG